MRLASSGDLASEQRACGRRIGEKSVRETDEHRGGDVPVSSTLLAEVRVKTVFLLMLGPISDSQRFRSFDEQRSEFLFPARR